CKVSRDKLDLRGYYYWTSHISIYIAKQKKYRERDTCYDKLFRLFRFMISPPKYAPNVEERLK
ncbi:13259_t:CDS:2, partial [Rhizophagus irregularis]